MTEISPDARAADLDPDGQLASVEMSFGMAQMKVRVRVTPTGLLSIGALASGILLSTVALVWVSTSVARRHPIAGRLSLR